MGMRRIIPIFLGFLLFLVVLSFVVAYLTQPTTFSKLSSSSKKQAPQVVSEVAITQPQTATLEDLANDYYDPADEAIKLTETGPNISSINVASGDRIELTNTTNKTVGVEFNGSQVELAQEAVYGFVVDDYTPSTLTVVINSTSYEITLRKS